MTTMPATDYSGGETRTVSMFSKLMQQSSSLGKKHAFKKYDQFVLNTNCLWGSTGSNITPVVQFQEIFDTKIMNKMNYFYF